MNTDLSKTVIARADKDNLAGNHCLRDAAEAFDKEVLSADNPRKILGSWAKLRRLWSEYSGEPLL